MKRRTFLAWIATLAGAHKAMSSETFPPVPVWKPSFEQPLDEIAERVAYYTSNRVDFCVLRYGTCVVPEAGLTDDQVRLSSRKVLSDIIGYHPDMNPSVIDDGNVVVQYNHPAINVVLNDIARNNWREIEERHLDGLVPSEVLITPIGPNKFDDVGKKALLGRAYMFMDAQDPEVVQISRHR